MDNDKFGRYEIKQELGRGGMGTVFHAYDPRFQRDVAIKVLPREFLHDPSFRARFEREARTIAALEHPAIVPVYDFGEEAGQPFLVMRFLPGGTLSHRLVYGPLPFDEVVRIITWLAPGLDEAHRQGIVHRDLKPDNILFDQRSIPCIADFGIAKLSSGADRITTGNMIIGTPAYMSPEQAQGELEIDGRSDIYAMGVILFEMLTGILPYQAPTPVGLVMKHLLEPVPSILNVAPDLPPGCEVVISKVMAKYPGDRFNTTAALLQALVDVSRGYQPEGATAANPPIGSTPGSSPSRKGHKQELVCPFCTEPLPPGLLLDRRITCRRCEVILLPTEAGIKFLCALCNAPNTVEQQFCIGCGQRLTVACVRCHAQNMAQAVLCHHCGANLKSAQLYRQEQLAARQRSQQEREQAFKEKERRQKEEKLLGLVTSLNYPTEQNFAIYQLSQMGEVAVTPVLKALFVADKPNTRFASAIVLGQMGNKSDIKALTKARIIKALIKALADPEAQVRYQAAAALGNFGGQAGQPAVEPLGDLLKDRNEQVRQQARISLDKIGGTRAQELLAKPGGLMGWLKGS